MQRVKLAIVHNTIAPYRHPLFEKLSQDLDLIVYYCAAKHSSRKWDLWPRNYAYKYKILPRIPFRTPIGDQSLNLSITKELVSNRPHVLILTGYTDPTTWLALTIAKLLKIPLIYWTEGIKEPQSILGSTTRPLRTLLIKKSDSIIVPGILSKNYVLSLGAKVEKVFVAPNAIDDELFIKALDEYREHKDQLRAELGFRDKILLLYVGRLCKQKGVIFLLEAYRKLKSKNDDLALIIVGYGELYVELRKMCLEMKINDVTLTGPITNYEKLIGYYSIADIFVLPTLSDVWGFVINEAMISGLPVVSTYASQAAIEMINSGKNGYIVKEADSEELYFALKTLVYDSKQRKDMGEKARETVMRRFDVRNMVAGFTSAIRFTFLRKCSK
jgi:glycosyltransferase involved in cell wall biosynthesis